MMEGLDATIVWLADLIQLAFETASVLVVAWGGVAFVAALVRNRGGRPFAQARRALAGYLIVALELQLAADIVATATHPSLQELGKLAAIALIRTFLNYFLVLELREEKRAVEAQKTDQGHETPI
ncbi:DUF1622 domain-containing protein [Shimia sp. SDUM112013]|uniref:DUF1622 domain-containing protein n=1 Tax=Shimia sp. SDUM112013 TaxID=3136160 RepID=UPI0032F0428B